MIVETRVTTDGHERINRYYVPGIFDVPGIFARNLYLALAVFFVIGGGVLTQVKVERGRQRAVQD